MQPPHILYIHPLFLVNPSLSEGYTLFAPRDDAFWKILLADAAAPDPFEQVLYVQEVLTHFR